MSPPSRLRLARVHVGRTSEREKSGTSKANVCIPAFSAVQRRDDRTRRRPRMPTIPHIARGASALIHKAAMRKPFPWRSIQWPRPSACPTGRSPKPRVFGLIEADVGDLQAPQSSSALWGSSRGTRRTDRLRKAKAPRGRVDPVGVGLSDGLIRLRYPASRGGLAHRSRAGGL